MKRKPPKNNVRRVRSIDGNARFTIFSKTGEIVQAEAFAERKLCLRLERDKKCKRYVSQPEKLFYIDQLGVKRSYTPDYKKWDIHNHITLIEVTRSERRKKQPRLREREQIGFDICRSRGWTYEVFTEDVLPDDTELANLQTLYCYRADGYHNQKLAELIFQQLHNGDHWHIRRLAEQISSQSGKAAPEVYGNIFYLLWHDEVEMDFKELLFENTQFHSTRLGTQAFVWAKGE